MIIAKTHLAYIAATSSKGGMLDNPTKSTKITPPCKPEPACEAQCGAA